MAGGVESPEPLRASEAIMKVVIGGASGLIGSELARALRARGDEVVPLVRGAGGVKWDGRSVPAGAMDGADAAVNLAGASVAGKRWNAAYKQQILESRVASTRAFVEAMRA